MLGSVSFLVLPADRPISFLEFFAAGKPVITTDAAGLAELVADERGSVVTRKNARALAQALISLSGESAARIEKRRRACTDFIRRYPDWDASAAAMAALIRG